MANERDYSEFRKNIARYINRFEPVARATLEAYLMKKYEYIFWDLDAMAAAISGSDPTGQSKLEYENDLADSGRDCITVTVKLANPDGKQTAFAFGLWENSIGTEDPWINGQSSGRGPKYTSSDFELFRGLLEGRVLAWFDGTAV